MLRPVLVLLLLLLAGQAVAAAPPPACAGKDLILALQADDAEAYARLAAAGARVPNGEGLLWRIEKAGLEPSYLFGTMHVTDDRLRSLAPEVAAALRSSQTVALELREVAGSAADRRAMQQAVMARAVRPDGRGLDIVPAASRSLVVEALANRGIPAAAAARMQPWMLLSVMSVPGCELLRAQGGIDAIDERIGLAGLSAGATLVGLETVPEQIDALSTIDAPTAGRLIVGMARLGPAFGDVFETLIGLYLRRQIGLFFGDLPMMGVDPEDFGAFADFMDVLVDRRNAVMAQRMQPLLEQGGAFIAVGALHLVGEKGLVALLRRDGYTATKVW